MLSVKIAGLQSLAGFCTSKSAVVAANAAMSAEPATTFQPSAAAVAAVHTAAVLAGTTLSGRLTAAATHLNSAAAGFSSHEADSAEVLAELPATL